MTSAHLRVKSDFYTFVPAQDARLNPTTNQVLYAAQ